MQIKKKDIEYYNEKSLKKTIDEVGQGTILVIDSKTFIIVQKYETVNECAEVLNKIMTAN